MGLQEVKQEIVSEATRKADLIKKQGQEEVAKLEAEMKKKVDAFDKEIARDMKKQADEMKKRELSAAELEGKNKK